MSSLKCDVDVRAYRSWEKSAGFELLQTHGAGVCAQEQNERHERDVGHVATGWTDQLSAPFRTLGARQRCPRRVHVLLREQR